MRIFELFGSILVDSSKADKSIAKTGKKAGGLGKTLGKGIKTAALFGAALGAGALVAGGAMFALGVKVGNTADEILDLNSITGMSVEQIQKWRKAAEVAGVATDAMTNASTKFTKALDTMSVEGHKGQEALNDLGYSLSDIENMSADERMNVLTEALAGVDDKTERAKLGADLFGGTWKEIAPIVDLGTEAMNKAKNSANIISEEDLKKANDFRITVENMKDQVGFFVTKIGIALLPMLQSMFDWFGQHMPAIQEVAGKAFAVIGDAVKSFAGFIQENVIPILAALWEWIEPNLPMIKEIFLDVIGSVRDILGEAVALVQEHLVPALVALWEWVEPYLPMIKDIFEETFVFIEDAINAVIDTVGWLAEKIEEHWSIVKPIIISYAALMTTKLIAKWIKLGVKALISAGKQVAAWVMAKLEAIKSAAVMVVQSAIIVGKWVWMGAQSLIQAGRMAAAWFIALGPIGWVILAIAGLVVLIIKYWDEIVEVTKKLWNKVKKLFVGLWSDVKTTFGNAIGWISGKVDNLVSYFTKLPRRIKSATSGMWDGIKDSFRSAINWLIGKWNDFQLKIAIPSNFLTRAAGLAGQGFTVNTPNIPRLAKGGDITEAGRVMVGEKGPEYLDLPKNAKVSPLDNAEKSVNISFEGANFSVRNDNDIKEIAKELGDYINRTGRRGGLVT